MTLSLETFGVLVGAVASSQVLVTYLQGKFNKNKVGAESAQILVDQVMKWASSLTSRIDKLEAELAEKDKIICDLRERIVQLEAV